MPASLDQIASQIIAALRVSDPELDTSIGTTTRKIIDAVSEQISEASVDQHMLTYQYDIDAKVEADLDDFCQLFGIARLAARRASGVVVFSRTGLLTNTVSIPVHTEIQSNSDPSITVQTVAGAVIPSGVQTVSVPVQAVEGGPAGNVGAGTLVTLTTSIAGVGAVTNVQPLSGGTYQETDEELRDRWKKTVFRSLAGTESMYLGIALNDTDCYVANVVGASKKRREQVQVIAGSPSTATMTVDDAAYIYASPVFAGYNIDSGDIFIEGSDYSWNYAANPPILTVLNSSRIPDGSIIEVDYEYQPLASRNDPANAITNRVDVWTGGSRAAGAVQTVVYNTSNLFVAGTGTLGVDNYVALDDTPPTAGNVFVPLAFGPILTVPSTLSISGTIYAEATAAKPLGTTEVVGSDTIYYAYRIVHDNTSSGYSSVSRFGLEWDITNFTTQHPANGTAFTVGGSNAYTYNSMIASIQNEINRWRLVGTDVKVHQAKQMQLKFNFALMYERNANQSQVNSAIDTAIADYLTNIGFQGRVQVSDILQTVHNVAGVDNVRFLNGSDYAGYNPATPNAYSVGIQRTIEGTVVQSYVDTNGRPYDLFFGDNELPVFASSSITQKAANSFGVF